MCRMSHTVKAYTEASSMNRSMTKLSTYTVAGKVGHFYKLQDYVLFLLTLYHVFLSLYICDEYNT